MKQVIQSIRNGEYSVADIPDPVARPNQVLIANEASIISAGTEKMLIDLARKSLLGKARERPDQVRRVLEKVRNEGLLQTIDAVNKRLDQPMALGYSSAGVVIACGEGIQRFRPGDRVASNGRHAGIVSVPEHLCAHVPDGIDAEQAAFAVIGAIALQGVRLTQADLGSTVFVIGLGLIGQIAVTLLKAAGCDVIGTDLDPDKCELAERMGCRFARRGVGAADVMAATHDLGADAVLIAASTSSSGPIELAGEAVRQKGRVVAVGAVGMNVPRRPYYFKEAELVVSCSYGPGRYDERYEDRGHDYPAAYVRWTEQRNMQTILDLMGRDELNLEPLISHRFDIAEAERAYDLIDRSDEPFLGIVLRYPDWVPERANRAIRIGTSRPSAGQSTVGCIGAGSFARNKLLPIVAKNRALSLHTLCAPGGLSAASAGKRLGFSVVTTDEETVLRSAAIDVVMVLSPHDQHARQVADAIGAGKHVFVEKPLAMTLEELAIVEKALAEAGERAPHMMVGFNRRFSPAARRLREVFAEVTEPLTVSVRFNAGVIPSGHWTQDERVGGGRIIGEACHAIDLATYLVDSPPVRVFAESIGGRRAPEITHDQSFITLRHANGSITSVGYLAAGDKAFPKERIEVIGAGRVGVIDDFRRVTIVRGGKATTHRMASQDKGHKAEIEAFARALQGHGGAPIPWDQLKSVTLAAILAVRSIREGVPFDILE